MFHALNDIPAHDNKIWWVYACVLLGRVPVPISLQGIKKHLIADRIRGIAVQVRNMEHAQIHRVLNSLARAHSISRFMFWMRTDAIFIALPPGIAGCKILPVDSTKIGRLLCSAASIRLLPSDRVPQGHGCGGCFDGLVIFDLKIDEFHVCSSIGDYFCTVRGIVRRQSGSSVLANRQPTLPFPRKFHPDNGPRHCDPETPSRR